jgi:c-di-GMP-binding flagellar brake protein YcgR
MCGNNHISDETVVQRRKTSRAGALMWEAYCQQDKATGRAAAGQQWL